MENSIVYCLSGKTYNYGERVIKARGEIENEKSKDPSKLGILESGARR